jgi:hypothetical protein
MLQPKRVSMARRIPSAKIPTTIHPAVVIFVSVGV